jgi:hypothetical protein
MEGATQIQQKERTLEAPDSTRSLHNTKFVSFNLSPSTSLSLVSENKRPDTATFLSSFLAGGYDGEYVY